MSEETGSHKSGVSRKLGRRDLFKFAAGSALGVAFTPVPWRLIEDTALWSQNWGWIPRPPRGELRTKFTTCTLCPAACGVRARTVGDQPVALAGAQGHPVSRGALCALGLAGHQLPYHPLRVTQVLRRGQPVAAEAAEAEIKETIADMRRRGSQELVAVLDERPGRTASWLYRKMLADLPNGAYLTPPAREGATLTALAGLLEEDPGPLGFDLEHVETILSFGAPVLDGWSTPGRVLPCRERFQIVQVETRESRTAALADAWLPIRPGTELALALSLAHVFVAERLCNEAAVRKATDFAAYREFVEAFAPERVAPVTGVAAETIVETARRIAGRRPAIAVGGGNPGGGPLGKEEEAAIAGLNLLLGGLERDGNIVYRGPVPAPPALKARSVPVREIEEVADGSIGVLFMDASVAGDALPWALVEKKLAPGHRLVVSFAPYRAGYAGRADFLIPTPLYLESLQDVPPPSDAAVASFSLSAPLVVPPPGLSDPVAFLGRVTGNPAVPSDWIQRRAAAVFQSGRGALVSYRDGKSIPVAEIRTEDAFWKALGEGAGWFDDRPDPKSSPRFALLGKHGGATGSLLRLGAGRVRSNDPLARLYPRVLLPFGWRGATGNAALSPLMSKVYQESGLRRPGSRAAVHPETGAACGLTHGCRGIIETPCGSCGVMVAFDPAVMPGVIQVAVGPEPPRSRSVLEVCNLDGCTWRLTRARIRRG